METLYALCALIILMFLGLTVHRHVTASEQDLIRSEVDNVALGVALDILNRAGNLRFDQHGRVREVEDLTPEADFGGAPSVTAAQTLDELHGLSMVREVAAEGQILPLNVSLEVRYVALSDDGFMPSGTQTPYKELIVTVSGAAGSRYTLSRVYGVIFNI
jgi:hypothetical protein